MDNICPKKKIAFKSSRIILCEGEQDKAFFTHLVESRHLPQFDVFCPSRPYTDDGAVEGYDDMLTAFTTGDGFQNITGILVQGDNDDKPQQRFNRIAKKIAAAEGYIRPQNRLQVVRADNRPPLIVMMFPWEEELGALETLCLISAEAANPTIKQCMDIYFDCARIGTWSLVKQHKMRLRCMIASICKTDPYTSLVHAWSRAESLIPLDHQCFRQIADFLQNFDQFILEH